MKKLTHTQTSTCMYIILKPQVASFKKVYKYFSVATYNSGAWDWFRFGGLGL